VGQILTVEYVAAALDAGDSASDIAWRVGCSTRSVRNVARRGGLMLPQARRRVARERRLGDEDWLRNEVEYRGRSISALAHELGVDTATARTAAETAGITRPGRAMRYPQLYEQGWLADRFAAGSSLASIASDVDCSITAVRIAARHLAVPRRPFAEVRYPQLHDADWLRQRYEREPATAKAIAAELGCTPKSVLRAVRAAGIATDPGRPKRRYPQLYNAQWLSRRYVREMATTVEIAAEVGCGVSAVNKALRRAHIAVRGRGTFPRLRSRGWLRRAYLKDRRTVQEIAEEVGCRPLTVERALDNAGIVRRRPRD
jgi:AraC-like DNA-binding protein